MVVSIIMLQKVAAMVDKVAADLCFRASKVRLLLLEKYFDFAACSAAGLLLDDNINNIAPEATPSGLKESLYIYRGAEYSAFLYFCAEYLRFLWVKWYIQHAEASILQSFLCECIF